MGHARQLKIFIYARILVTFLFLLFTVALILKQPEAIDELSPGGVVRLMAFSFLFSVLSWLFAKVPRFEYFVTYLQVIWDLLFVTVLLLFTGGVTSPYSFLYLLSIMNAGVLQGRRQALYTASLCGILYGAINDLQYFGYLEQIGLTRDAAQQLGAAHILYTIFMNLAGFFLTGLITGYLSDQARKSAEALATKSIDYDELERLSSTIVANLESGLITVTREGMIRVFNRYAEELTGKTLAQVYDLPLAELFPPLAQALEDVGRGAAGEFSWSPPGQPPLILGYGSVPFTDTRGDLVGAIVNFKDLTQKKRMEEALKRSEKLAALGELSARMAHEIRNPLAAMSGSVQLLADHGDFGESDQRLMAIIVRETDRLNELITSFLVYARPVSPRKERIELHRFLEEMRLLTSSDSRFDGVTLLNRVPPVMTVSADADQIRQVLINLLNNAAEATGQGGEIVVSARREARGGEDFALITVSDNGCGITDEVAAHLFEPFWTTKGNGTGLGLAITYRIVAEHGGAIRAESAPGGGCRMVVSLPL